MTVLTSKLIISLIDQVTGPLRGVNSALKSVQGQIQQNNAAMDAMRGRMVDAAAAGFALVRAISSPIKAAIEFESAMADVKKVVDFETPTAFKQMSADVRALSIEMPMAAEGIASIVAAAGQSGLATNELLPFAEMAAKVGVAWDTSAAETGDALAKLKTALSLSIADTGALADAINHLGNRSAASAPDILDVVKRVGPMASQFGLSAEQAAAFGAAMVGSGFQSEVASTSFLNMGRALTKGASATNRQSAAFAQLKLSSTGVAKAMQKDAVGTIQAVLERLRAVPDHMRASLISDLFGDEARALSPLISNGTLLADTLALVADKASYAGSAQAEYDQRSKTTANSLQLFRNRINDLAISIGDALLPGLNALLQAFGPIVTSISDLATRFPQVTSAIVALTAAIVAFRVAAIAAQWGALFLKGGLLQVAATGLIAARGLLTILNPIRMVTSAMGLLKVALISTGVGAALIAIGALGAFIYQNWTGVGIAFESFSSAMMGALGPGTVAVITGVTDAVGGLIDWLWALTGPLSDESWSIWGAKAGLAVADIINWFSDLPAAITGLNWSAVGASIVAGVSGAFSGVAAIVSAAVASVTDAFSSVDWSAIGGSIMSSVRAAWYNSSLLVAPVIEALRVIDWGALGLAAADGVRSGLVSLSSMVIAAIGSINWMAGAAAISNGIRGIFTHGVESIASIDWGGLGQRVGGLIGDALAAGLNIWSAIIDAVSGAGGGDGAGGVVSAIVGAVAGAVVGVNWLGVAHTVASGLIRAIAETGPFFVGVVQGLFGNISLQEAGVRLIESLKNGAIAAFDSFLSWVRSIPSQIIAAIGRIDLSSIIKWPSMPSWLGGGAASSAAGPAVDGARAKGGPVDAGGTYLVGERGPELFVPKRDGTIIPASVTTALKVATAAAAALSFPTLAPGAQIPAPNTPKIEAASLPALTASIPELPALRAIVPPLPIPAFPDITTASPLLANLGAVARELPLPELGFEAYTLPEKAPKIETASLPALTVSIPELPALRAIVPPLPIPALPDISMASPLLANLGAVARGLPIPELDFGAYTLPEPAIEAIMQAPAAAPAAPATTERSVKPAETTRSVSINPTIHITMSVTGVNDPEAIARELGRRVTQQLEGALHEIDSSL